VCHPHHALPLSSVFFSCYGAHRHLHSFPTRRSSDLSPRSQRVVSTCCIRSASSDRFGGSVGAPGARGRGSAARSRVASRSACSRSEEHTSELQSRFDLVCRLLLEKKKKMKGGDNKAT